MHPDFANAVDPIFQAALRIEEKIEFRDPSFVIADERQTLIRKIEQAEAKIGNSDEWNHAKYAICAWIDQRLNDLPWGKQEGNKSWWKENCLERRFFSSRDAYVEFFERASKASGLTKKNAVEVFYLCVVLGFRGLYDKQDPQASNEHIEKLRLPQSIEEWCSQTVKMLHLRHGRPIIAEMAQVGGSAKPLAGKRTLVLYSMLSTLLVAVALGCICFVFEVFK